MKLIDADLLADEVNKEYREQKQLYEEIGYKERFGIVRGLGKASEIIAKQPIVDAAPVIHARWVGIEYDGYADGSPVYSVWECGHCGEEHTGEESTLTNFCPHCGAKMDGGEIKNE